VQLIRSECPRAFTEKGVDHDFKDSTITGTLENATAAVRALQ